MPRLLICGMAAGGAFILVSLFQIPILIIPSAIIVFIGMLVLTGSRRGIPIYLHLLITFRTRLLLAAPGNPSGWQGQAVSILDLKSDDLTVDASEVLSAPEEIVIDTTLDDWEIVADSRALSGFEIVTDTMYLLEEET